MAIATIESAIDTAESLSGRLLVDAAEPFVSAAGHVLDQACHVSFKPGPLEAGQFVSTRDEWNAVVAVLGERVAGVVLYSMSELTACRIASKMVGETTFTLGEIELSALEELANMITGNASVTLERNGFKSTISPPRLLLGAGRFICARPLRWLAVPLKTGLGTIHVALALRQGDLAD